MACGDLPTWFLRHRIAVIDLTSPTWHPTSIASPSPGGR